jgi:hypothetical protein
MVRLLMLASVFACVILPPASGVRRRERDVAVLCQRVADHSGRAFHLNNLAAIQKSTLNFPGPEQISQMKKST